eukprot:scaffold185002_cov17-Prasinocladus_malaysianus.AAC.1
MPANQVDGLPHDNHKFVSRKGPSIGKAIDSWASWTTLSCYISDFVGGMAQTLAVVLAILFFAGC